MRIGILSDSHGRAVVTGQVVRALIDAGAEMLIHLGDVETERVIDELAGHDAHLVFGNCDMDITRLSRYADGLGIAVDHPVGRIEIDSRQIVFTHGDRSHLVRQALADGVDYLLHGHIHSLRDERIGPTRIISPGALFRASRYTAVVLDPLADRLDIIEAPMDA